MNVYKFGTRKAAKVKPIFTRPVVDKNEESLPTSIQGKPVGSIPEARVSVALDRLGFKYIYQYSIAGGTSVRGGQVVDFWTYTAPLPTPIFVQGLYWHRSSKETEDRLKQIDISRRFRGQVNDPLLIWEDNISSVDEAYQYLKNLLF